MADLKAFTSLLDSTLSAPRLSGTKVQSLTALSTDLTAKNLDTDLITSFYRANNALSPAGQGRISSLYVFDAIARAARAGATKEKEKGKAREGRGMTGLITKMEGVAESWVGGMMDDASGAPWMEGRDKMRKILDIWSKSGTFPPVTLDRLKQKLSPSAPPSAPGSVKSPGYGGNPFAGPSTTPPGTPPASGNPVQATFGVNDGYANLGGLSNGASSVSVTGDPRKARLQAGQAAQPSSTPAPPSTDLPQDILKLLGVGAASSAPVQTAFSPAPTSTPTTAAVDIASILAAVRPGGPGGPGAKNTPPAQHGVLPSSVSVPPPAQGSQATPNGAAAGTGSPFSAAALASLNLNPQQLAALSAITQQPPAAQAPIPVQNGHGPPFSPHPGNGNGAGPYPPFPPSGSHGPGPGPGPGLGGPPFPQKMHTGSGNNDRPYNDIDPRGPPRRGSRDGPAYSDRERDRDGRWGGAPTRRDGPGSNGPGPHSPRDGFDRGRFDSGPPGRGPEGGWGRNGDRGPPPTRDRDGRGDRDRWNGAPRPRSRSPPFHRDRDGCDGRDGRDGYGPGAARGGHDYDRNRHDRFGDRGDARWRNGNGDDRRDGARDQRYGNGPQGGGPQSPQRSMNGDRERDRDARDPRGGRAGGGPAGRAPPPAGRDMQLEGDRPASGPGIGPGSVGGGTPAGSAKDGSGSAPMPPQRTPQQHLSALPLVGGAVGGGDHHTSAVPPSAGGANANANANANVNAAGSGERLETFNIATFNPMSPDSWAALGRAFKNTTGREPGQMDLMGFLAGQGPVPLPPAQGPGMGMSMGMGMGGSGGGDMGGGGGMGMGGMGGMGMGMGMGMPGQGPGPMQGQEAGMGMDMSMGMGNMGGPPGGFGGYPGGGQNGGGNNNGGFGQY